MHQPRMIVLALIGTGLRYGFEMEEFAQKSQMREWAKIGMSTIYKVLGHLERDGAIEVELEESAKGPVRKAYALTDTGRRMMNELVAEALASRQSVYSDRIAGLVFAPLLPTEFARTTIGKSIESLERVDCDLSERQKDQEGNVVGAAVLTYYREIYAAERKAMRTIIEYLD